MKEDRLQYAEFSALTFVKKQLIPMNWVFAFKHSFLYYFEITTRSNVFF